MTVTAIDRVSARARGMDARRVPRRAGRALLVLLAAVLVGVGWSAGRTATLLVLVATWAAAAVAEGWCSARPRKEAVEPGGPQRVRLVS